MPDLVHHRQDLVPDRGSELRRVVVGRIPPRPEVERSAEREDLLATHFEERFDVRLVVSGRPRKAERAGAGHQADEQPLGSVVQRVCASDLRGADLGRDGRPRTAPSGEPPGFDGLTLGRRVLGGPEVEREPQSDGHPPHVRGVLTGIGTQPMVEVEDGEADLEEAPKVPERIEQADRVGTAAARHEDQIARDEHLVLAGRLGDPLQHASDRRRPARHVSSRRRVRPSGRVRRSPRRSGGSRARATHG